MSSLEVTLLATERSSFLPRFIVPGFWKAFSDRFVFWIGCGATGSALSSSVALSLRFFSITCLL